VRFWCTFAQMHAVCVEGAWASGDCVRVWLGVLVDGGRCEWHLLGISNLQHINTERGPSGGAIQQRFSM
jgi:hypothetical protein